MSPIAGDMQMKAHYFRNRRAIVHDSYTTLSSLSYILDRIILMQHFGMLLTLHVQ